MVVYFSHNQTNSGAAVDQDLFIWAQIAVIDDAGVLPTLYYYYFTSVPNSTGLQNFGNPGANPIGLHGTPDRRNVHLPDRIGLGMLIPQGGVGTGTGTGDASFMVARPDRCALTAPSARTIVPCDARGPA